MIIGLTGTNGAGKTLVCHYLQKKGFYFFSLSDVIRDELKAEGREATRENLIEEGNALRMKFGSGVLAERVSQKFRSDCHYIVDSIRNPAEVEVLRRQPNFHLLHLDAPIHLRYERVRQRGDERIPKTFEEFVHKEEIEMHSTIATNQQLLACYEMAEVKLINDSTIEALERKLDELVVHWLKMGERPSWDDYFMQIAKMVAMRSNCIKRKVAAVIVKDKRIISTGYNGTPRGVKNCNEGGCPRCNALATSGTALEECLCSHGEENAIVQASYHGISIKDAILYTTFAPCLMCTKMIINSGLQEVIYNLDYPLNETSLRLLAEAGVTTRQLKVD